MITIIHEDDKPTGLKINKEKITPTSIEYKKTPNKKTLIIEDEYYDMEILKDLSTKDFLFDSKNKVFIDICINIDFNLHEEILEDDILRLRIRRTDALVTIGFIQEFKIKDTSIYNIAYNRHIHRYIKSIESNIVHLAPMELKINTSEIPDFQLCFEYSIDANKLPKDIYSELKFREKEIKAFFDLAVAELEYRPINIYCEGKTDYLHLKSALRYFKKHNKFKYLTINFCEKSNINGDSQLLNFCQNIYLSERDDIIICLFDDDNHNITKKLKSTVKNWGNNVYSLITPNPSDRKKQEFCIELYYENSILNLKDNYGRKVYLREGFNKKNGFHNTENVICLNPSNKKSLIVDSNVIDKESGANVALSKAKFADYIYNETPPFDSINFDRFEDLFNLIDEIKKDKYYYQNIT